NRRSADADVADTRVGHGRRRNRKTVIVAAAALIAATIATVTVGCTPTSQGPSGPTPTSAASRTYGAPVTLPFTGLNIPSGVAIDTAGNLYVTDYTNQRVVSLAAGSTAQAVQPFTGLKGPEAVAVDT